MNSRLIAGVFFAFFAGSDTLVAQEHPVRRVANIVSVAVEEYARGVDAQGKLISDIEYQEATDFLADARAQAARLPGARAASALAILDSILVAVFNKMPPADVKALEQRFAGALGSEAALELPSKAADLAEGRTLFQQTCASCHGLGGKGDGPAGAAMNPKPPAVGDAATMRDVSPATMFRIISVGIGGTPMPAYAAQMTPEQRWNIVSYLMSLRATSQEVAEGEGLFTQRCMQCHGALGAGDGAFARALSRLPQEIGSFGWQASRSDEQLAFVVRQGIAGTAMPPSGELSTQQLHNVVAFLRTMPLKSPPSAVQAAQSDDAASAARRVLSFLDQSLTASRAGRTSDAADRAFDAYIAFEPMETRARAKSPGLVANMEKLFADFRGAVRGGDLRGAERARDVIEARMPSIIELTRPPGSGWQAFWQSFLIIFREGLEAILVIGAIVAFLLKTGHRERLRSIWIGVGAALAASAVTAIVLKTILSAMPASRGKSSKGITMLVAVAVLFSVSYWLISKVEAAKWQQFIREKVTNALEHGGGRALAFVAFLAVYREGAETALFYQALFNEGTNIAFCRSRLGIVVGVGRARGDLHAVLSVRRP